MANVVIAFVDAGGNVTLVLNTDDTLATSFTSSANIIDVTNNDMVPNVGWTYDGTDFIPPATISAVPVAPNPNPIA